VARGQGGQTFGISPADAAAGAYFTYTLDPGASKSDRALVSNYTGTEMTLQPSPLMRSRPRRRHRLRRQRRKEDWRGRLGFHDPRAN